MLKAGDPPVIVEQAFEADAKTVWNAITRDDQMRKWYFDTIPAFKPQVGFSVEFNVNSGRADFLHQWTVTEVIPNKKIAYDWQYEQYDGRGLVEFEIFETADGTTVRLTNHISEDWPEDVPEFTRENCTGGWEYFIQQRLKSYLDA